MNRPLDLFDVESTTSVKKFSVAHQAIGTVGEAFGTGLSEALGNVGSTEDLLVVVVEAAPHLFDERGREAFGGETEAGVHQPEAGREAQGEVSAERIDLRKVLRR